jgi:hypothetical protein
MIRDGEASLPKWGNKTPNCIFAIVFVLSFLFYGIESSERLRDEEDFFRLCEKSIGALRRGSGRTVSA